MTLIVTCSRGLNDSFSDAPTSAQPTSSYIETRKKIIVVKKVKKGMRGLHGRQRDGPWPPRLHNLPTQVKGPGTTPEAVSHEPSQTDAAGPLKIPENRPGIEPVTRDLERQAECKNQDRSQDQVSPHSESDVPKASPIGSPCDVLDNLIDNQQDLISRSPEVQPAVVVVNNEAQDRAMRTSAMHEKQTATAQLALEPHLDNVQETDQTGDVGARALATQLTRSVEPDARPRRRLEQGETTLRDITNGASPHRVEKSQKQRRQTKATQQSSTAALLRSQGAPSHLNFEQTWDMLRLAHHSDISRRDHDVARQAEHFEEVKAALQSQINRYSMNLADEKSQHDVLKASMSQLRDKAKTNQKFAAGLQKDYEKLKKATLDCQEEYKRTLQQKTVELEQEKNSLRFEVGLVLDHVAKGNKKLKSMADELYLRLELSEAKRIALKDELTKQTSLYEEEKATRNYIAGRLLSFGPSVQEQLRDYSRQLTEKFENLQASVHNVSSQQQQEPKGIEECLKVLQQIKDTPFLTLEHVQKSETMLRAVHEG